MTKRPYAQPNAQRRSIYTDDDTWATLKALGTGNASAGIRISALHHGRLVEVLQSLLIASEHSSESHYYSERPGPDPWDNARTVLSEIESTK